MDLKIFNATKKEIDNKKFNIFIGISVGVKPLTKDLAKAYIKWALKHTRDDVVILIADYIAKINYKVFSSYSENKSLKRALKEGEGYKHFFEEILLGFPLELKKRIKILRWNDVFTEELKRDFKIIEEEFKSNPKFKEKILFFVREYAKRRGKEINQEKLDYLAKYMFMELPTMFKGVKFENKKYDLLFYPTFIESGMGQMVSSIAKGKIFLNLKRKMNLGENIALVESYIKK